MRIGLLGAGRTRQGLGPFLASAFTRAGARVVAIAGRERGSTERSADSLAARLGHPIVVAADAHALAGMVDALVVAAPVPGHLDGLDAALAAFVPCLCEKPLVAPADAAAGRQRIDAFRTRGLLLAENCQWPFVLPALFELHPQLRAGGRAFRTVAMGLAPAWPGPAMVADSLSHVLSVVQALVPLPADARALRVEQSDGGPTATANTVRFDVAGPAGAVAVVLQLTQCPEQPRPAWIEVDGCRIDRRIGAEYSLSFARPDGTAVLVQDPLQQLVYGFLSDLRARNRDRTKAHADAIALRLRLYADVLDQLGIRA